MSTEVSGLIRGFQRRRLQTQPGDDQLFQRSGGHAPRPARLFAMPVVAPVPAMAAPVRRPRAPVRRRSRAAWPLAILGFGVIGFFAIAYGPFGAQSDDDAAPAIVLPALPAPPPLPPAVKVEPIAQPVAAPLPAAVPDPVAAPAPAAEPVAAAATPPAATVHHRRHVKAKVKKVAIAKHAPAAAHDAAAPAPAPAAQPARHVSQSDDNENPL